MLAFVAGEVRSEACGALDPAIAQVRAGKLLAAGDLQAAAPSSAVACAMAGRSTRRHRAAARPDRSRQSTVFRPRPNGGRPAQSAAWQLAAGACPVISQPAVVCA
eukprot:8594952-Alexandrium_andersonii.AAC.1